MAGTREYLANGATSFAAGGFTTAAGAAGSGFVNSADLVVAGDTTGIVSSLDWSGLTTGINALTVARTHSGQCGGASAGRLKVDIDDVTGQWTSAAPTKARFIYAAGGGIWYVEAAGNSNVIENTFVDAPNAILYCFGGTWRYFNLYAGTVNIDATVTLSALVVDGGSITVEYKAGALATLDIFAGTAYIKRPASTKIRLFGGELILDDEGTTATAEIEQCGGRFTHLAGNVTLHTANAGEYTAARLRRSATITTRNRRPGFKRQDNATFLTVSDVRYYPTDTI